MADNFLNYTGLGYFKDKCDAEYTNVIETVKLNGTALTPDANKAVDVEVPTKTSDLTNDGDGQSNFATEEYVDENGGKIDEIQLNGTALTITDKAVNIEDFVSPSGSAAGEAGLVPAPQRLGSPSQQYQFLSVGGWQRLGLETSIGTSGPSAGKVIVDLCRYQPESTTPLGGPSRITLPAATTTADGVMSSADKTKLDSLPTSSDVDTAIADALANSGDPYLPESDIDDKIAAAQVSVLDYKGAVATYADLPASGNKKGDVWDVQDTGINYAWSGTAWDALGTSVDTSAFWTSTTGQSNTLNAITTSQIDALFA